MREQKPVRPEPLPHAQADAPSAPPEDKNGVEGAADGKPLRARPVEPKLLRPELTMHSDINARKLRGRLNRETMNKLGKVLESYYDDVRNQGVPDRFKELLKQFDDRKIEDKDKGSS
jgi:hypothetical protein